MSVNSCILWTQLYESRFMPPKKNNYSCFILTPLSKNAPKIKRPAKTKIEFAYEVKNDTML